MHGNLLSGLVIHPKKIKIVKSREIMNKRGRSERSRGFVYIFALLLLVHVDKRTHT